MSPIFNATETRVLGAMMQLSRYATANEIARWADNMSWNTAEKVLVKLHSQQVVNQEIRNGKIYWKIRVF